MLHCSDEGVLHWSARERRPALREAPERGQSSPRAAPIRSSMVPQGVQAKAAWGAHLVGLVEAQQVLCRVMKRLVSLIDVNNAIGRVQ